MTNRLRGILIVCRSPAGIVPVWKWLLKKTGVSDVRGTAQDGAALDRVIGELKPRLIFMESAFYRTATPYMVGQMLRKKPYLRIAVFSLGEFPEELERAFALHEAAGYISLQDGMAEFRRGVKKILKGERYVARRVRRGLERLPELPGVRVRDSEREDEVMRLLAEGLTAQEIADTLKIGQRTVDRHKNHLFKRYHARNTPELIKAGVLLGKITFGKQCV